ncbi:MULTISPECIES: DUF2515 family protein [Burkholderia]|uniref:DUF2515 family protein n=1 Tax=Burkholderia TaxID=32008 RepID=UPI0008BF840D|nr:hypothetical protein [Burkholderia cepacia]MBJ9755286.1 hypothetical protein [Burkholderia cepacia]SEU07478.1 hypothetical protein SAMN03159335_03138 [Burkholderia cepacia]
MATLAESTTDPKSNTCIDAHCDCKFIWSLAQQYAMAQLDTRTPILKDGTPDYRFSSHTISETTIEPGDANFVSKQYGARARRVASSYARMFLEEFHLGEKDKLGRFYWTGLGAFAAKQVSANIESWQVKKMPGMDAVHEGLGKGNLWIYNDLLPWCYGYAADPVMFQECAKQRDSRQFAPAVQNNLMRQQWAAEVVPKCPVYIEASANMDDAGSGKPIAPGSPSYGYFQWTPRVASGFDLVKQWEETTNEKKKASLAFNHLWVMAQHEQGEVLQDLIYNDKAFIRRLQVQRLSGAVTDPDQWWNYPLHPFNAMIPPLQLSFVSKNETSDMQYRSNAPKDLILEDYPQRMAWIKDTGKLFHFLMQKKREYMLGELKGIAAMGGRLKDD